ncbi:hypothetical protein GDO81_006146 [Engystomops pustulosus]|uniref:Uncharacterized protein n=1 Tax=Engystomops pustulosus TaxID=76066 RepID=A0AAV7CVZ0_ENGPU|nr:hypothetical protein GDO81_006146 [Engystomops pustulosus]
MTGDPIALSDHRHAHWCHDDRSRASDAPDVCSGRMRHLCPPPIKSSLPVYVSYPLKKRGRNTLWGVWGPKLWVRHWSLILNSTAFLYSSCGMRLR